MTYLTQEQRELIEKITKNHMPKNVDGPLLYNQPSGSENVWKLLNIIRLQNLVIEKAVEQRDRYALFLSVPARNDAWLSDNQELKDIMEGKNGL